MFTQENPYGDTILEAKNFYPVIIQIQGHGF
jgi:hypothetical protein